MAEINRSELRKIIMTALYQISVYKSNKIKYDIKDVIKEMEKKITEKKESLGNDYQKSPNNAKFLRNRLDSSIKIFEKYFALNNNGL